MKMKIMEDGFLSDFEKFVNGLQWRKDFNADNEDHYQSAVIVYGSVYGIRERNRINLNGAKKNVNLHGLIGNLMDEGLTLEEIASDGFTEPKRIALYFHEDHNLFYAVISN